MNFLSALKKHFGYTAFRPLQEEIVRDALAGRDVFALMPTGGGKSLCFQLPALLRDGLTIVVSPLISLMKDQVDALQASGVAATFLNSALDGTQARSRLRGLYNGEFRLLYVAPERLMLESFIEKIAGLEHRSDRNRRSALHQRVGPRFPAGISRIGQAAFAFARSPDHGVDRDRDGTCAARYPPATETARPAVLRRQLRSSESDLSCRPEICALRSIARLLRSAGRTTAESFIARAARAQTQSRRS